MRSRMLLLGGQTTALGLMMAFLVVPASALFLHTYGAELLPWAYLGVAGAGVLVSAGVTRAGRRLSLGRLAMLLASVYLGIVLLGWIALAFWDAAWVTFPLLVLFPLSIPVGFVAVGSQAVRLYDIRGLKAEFPRVVAGFSLGFAVGGLAAAALTGPLGAVEHLLAVDVLAALAMLGFIAATARRFPAELLSPPEPAPVAGPAGRVEAESAGGSGARAGRWAVLRDPLVLAVLGYQILSAAVTQLLDYTVWERAAAYFPSTDDLARFQGVYGAAINIVSITFVALLAAWLLTHFGIRLGLAANPAIVLVMLVVMVALGQTAGIAGFLFLAFACVSQIADISTTDGLTRTSIAATYQAMPRHQRLQAQTTIEGAGVPLAIGFVGVLLLVKEALGLDIRSVVLVTLVLTAGWLVLAVHTHRRYGEDLAEVLVERSWDPAALRIDGPEAVAAVRHLLDSGDLADRATGLDALVDSEAPTLVDEVVRALDDDDPAVELVALEAVARAGLGDMAEVREALRGLLDHGSPVVRVVASAALVGEPGAEGETARGEWSAAVQSGDESMVAAALVGASSHPGPFFVPALVDLAGSAHPPVELVGALSRHGEQLQPVLEHLWPQTPEDAESSRRRDLVIRAVARSQDRKGRAWLLGRLADDRVTREDVGRIVDALAHHGGRPVPASVPASAVAAPIERQIARVAAVLEVLRQLELAGVGPSDRDEREQPHHPDGPDQTDVPDLAIEVLTEALRDELVAGQECVEQLMGLVAAPKGTGWVVVALGSGDESRRGTAIELVEIAFGRSLGEAVVVAIDPTLTDAARLERLVHLHRSPAAPGETRGWDGQPPWLVDLVRDPAGEWDDPWLRACALRTVPRLAPDSAAELAGDLAGTADPVVRETAEWVLARCS